MCHRLGECKTYTCEKWSLKDLHVCQRFRECKTYTCKRDGVCRTYMCVRDWESVRLTRISERGRLQQRETARVTRVLDREFAGRTCAAETATLCGAQ